MIVGLVMNLFSSEALGRKEPIREVSIAGYWTLNPQPGDANKLEGGVVLSTDGLDNWGDSTTVCRVPQTATMHAAHALVSELLEPAEHLTFAPADNGAVIIVDGRGSSRIYQTSGGLEWQTFDAGSCQTRTFWKGPALLQEIRLGTGISVIRSYRPMLEGDRLVEIVVLKVTGMSDRSAFRIYESDRVP